MENNKENIENVEAVESKEAVETNSINQKEGFLKIKLKSLKAYFKNENGPHITVSIGEVDGIKGKAYETGLLHFSEIKSPFMISGRFGYYINGKGKIMDNSIFKEKENDDEISL